MMIGVALLDKLLFPVFTRVERGPEVPDLRRLVCGGKRLKTIFLEWFFKFSLPCGNGRKFEDFIIFSSLPSPAGTAENSKIL